MRKIKVLAYARVSTKMQVKENTFDSIESQCFIIREWIEAHSDTHELVGTYTDKGFSGKNMDRPAINELKKRLVLGDIGLVISYRMDRMSRDPFSYHDFEVLLEMHNVSILYTNDINPDNTPTGNFQKGIALTAAKYEREQTTQRIKDKRLSSLKAGEYSYGMPPVGYTLVDKCLIKDERCAMHIEQIFSLFNSGKKPYEIVNTLREQGVFIPAKITKSKKKRFGNKEYTETDIRRILQNPCYAGYVYTRDKEGKYILFNGNHEGIISVDIYNKAQKNLAKAKQVVSPVRMRNFYMLKKKIFCSCGKHMTVTRSGKTTKTGEVFCYYTCTDKLHKRSACSCNTSISQSILDSVVFAVISKILSSYISLSDVQNGLVEYKKDSLERKDVLATEIRNLSAKIKRAMDSFLMDDNVSDIAKGIILKDEKRLAELKAEAEELKGELRGYDNKAKGSQESIQADLDNPEKLEGVLSDDDKLALVDDFVEKITLEVLSKQGTVKLLSIKIMPTENFQNLGSEIEVKAEIDNSYGKGLWKILSPFKIECSSPKPTKNRTAYKRHFLCKLLKLKERQGNLSVREYAKKLNLKPALLGRKLTMLSRLSPQATAYIKNLTLKSSTDKLSFLQLEKISKSPQPKHLLQIKALLKN